MMSIVVSPSTSADAASTAGAASLVLSAVRALPPGRPAIVLIDGRSGAGKSTLARAVHRGWPRAQLLQLEDFYPGWAGLEAASEQLQRQVLHPISLGHPAHWRGWDWTLDAPGTVHTLTAEAPLLVEGCGALSRANRALAHFGVWVELETAERFHRAALRDDGRFDSHWRSWAAQEQAFIDRERPSEAADLIVSG